MREFAIKCRLRCVSPSCRCNGRGHTSRAELRPGTAAVVKISANLDCEVVSPLGSVSSRRPQRERTRSVLPHVASAVLQLSACSNCGSRKETAASTLPATHPESTAESFLHTDDVVVRRQDTSRPRVQAVEPFVGDLRVAQVFDSCHSLPDTFGEEFVRRLSRVRSVNRKSCAWSCGALSRPFRGPEKSISSLSSS